MSNIQDLIGKTFESVANVSNEELRFMLRAGGGYRFYHEPDCCESVTIEEVIGDLTDLEGTPILGACEESNHTESEFDESCTWTFYKFSTIKGSVTVRWCGRSNGYYSERVSFGEIES